MKGNGLKVTEHGIVSAMESSFNLQTAKAMQEATRYKNAAALLRFLAGLAALAAFYTELGSCFAFNDWLLAHEWTEYGFLRSVVEWFTETVPMVLVPFGVFGVLSLLDESSELCAEWLTNVIRFLFKMAALLILLVPILRVEQKRLSLIGLLVGIYFLSKWAAKRMADQRPRDWKIIVAERKRLGWGPEEFARALLKGRASDGNSLAVLTPPEPILMTKEIQEKVDNLLLRGAYAELEALKPPPYEPMASFLKLTIKQRFPHALKPMECLERDGMSPEDQKALSDTMLYVHTEIVDRVRRIIEA